MILDKATREDWHQRAMEIADHFDEVIQLFRREGEIDKDAFLSWINWVASTISELDALQQHVTARFFDGAWWEGNRVFYGVSEQRKEDSGDAPI